MIPREIDSVAVGRLTKEANQVDIRVERFDYKFGLIQGFRAMKQLVGHGLDRLGLRSHDVDGGFEVTELHAVFIPVNEADTRDARISFNRNDFLNVFDHVSVVHGFAAV